MTRLDAKLAFHRDLTCAVIARGSKTAAEDFDVALANGYAEIDRLFDDDEGRAKRRAPMYDPVTMRPVAANGSRLDWSQRGEVGIW